MGKKALPPMDAANLGKNPPFVPEVAKTVVGPPDPNLRESTVGLYGELYDYNYAGQNQTGTINIKVPKPVGFIVDPRFIQPGPVYELGVGPADPALDASFASYTGTGYDPLRYQTKGTINRWPPAPGT